MLKKTAFIFLLSATTFYMQAITMHDAAESTRNFLVQPGASAVDAAVYIGSATALSVAALYAIHGPIPCKDRRTERCTAELELLQAPLCSSLMSFISLDQSMSFSRALTLHIGIPFFGMIVRWAPTNDPLFTLSNTTVFIPSIGGFIGLGIKNAFHKLIFK